MLENSARLKGSPRFSLGKLVMTDGVQALAAAGTVNPAALIDRHVTGDWGDLSTVDFLANEEALLDDLRVLSRYDLPAGNFYVITEWDRSLTTVLLVTEY